MKKYTTEILNSEAISPPSFTLLDKQNLKGIVTNNLDNKYIKDDIEAGRRC